jgi:hypothetical protein
MGLGGGLGTRLLLENRYLQPSGRLLTTFPAPLTRYLQPIVGLFTTFGVDQVVNRNIFDIYSFFSEVLGGFGR